MNGAEAELVSAREAAERLHITVHYFNDLSRRGRIRPAVVTGAGWRLFLRADVDRLKQELSSRTKSEIARAVWERRRARMRMTEDGGAGGRPSV
jgi:DNA-binding transcriptional MerR regulator